MGRGAVAKQPLWARAAGKNTAKLAVSAQGPAAHTGHLDVLGAWCLCCPQLGPNRQKQKAGLDAASCPGVGPEEIKDRIGE